MITHARGEHGFRTQLHECAKNIGTEDSKVYNQKRNISYTMSATHHTSPKPHVVVLTGAGISAESGLRTFRDAGGLWEGYSPEEVATPEAWYANQELVLKFYNERREQLEKAEPNAAHKALATLESKFEVTVITQNVDNLHERAGSSNVVHLHGMLTQVRSSVDPTLIYEWGYKALKTGDKCERGSQLRPHIVWFGEAVPEIERAMRITSTADYLLVVGTSLVVYPAASLIHDAPPHAKRVIVNPEIPEGVEAYGFESIETTAGVGVPQIVSRWLGE